MKPGERVGQYAALNEAEKFSILKAIEHTQATDIELSCDPALATAKKKVRNSLRTAPKVKCSRNN